MYRQSQAPLIYRITTDVFGASLGLSILVLAVSPNLSSETLIPGFGIYLIISAFMLMTWWRLGSMVPDGILKSKINDLFDVVLLFVILSMPLILRLLISEAISLQSFALVALPISFALATALLALMVRNAHAYQNKSKWRLIHHSLWIGAGAYLLTLLIPQSWQILSGLPVRVLVCAAFFLLPPVIRKLGVSFVATPAKPPAAVRSGGRRETQSSAPAASSSQQSSDTPEGQSRRRYRRRPRRPNQGGSRRRV